MTRSTMRRWWAVTGVLALSALLTAGTLHPATARAAAVSPDEAFSPAALTSSSTVTVGGISSSWSGGTSAPSPEFDLFVDGTPYTVKGVTWGPRESAGDQYLPGVVAMGANTIRTWGTGAGSAALLDSAARHGIRVVAGFWLMPGGGPGSGGCIDYVTDTAYKSQTRADILRWVNAYKTKPAVLMWNVGNESLLGMSQCWSGAKLEQQRNAYTAYVDEVARAIKAADPNHPVTSTDAWTGAWRYYAANTPNLDIYSVNSYGGVCYVPGEFQRGGYTKPYLITEAGAAGDWEVRNDANGVPTEPTDAAKAKAYIDAWNCISADSDHALGVTFFNYGTETDYGGVWYNVLTGGERRLGWYSLAQAFGGTASGNRPPRIDSMTIENPGAVTAGSRVTIVVSATDPDGDRIAYSVGAGSKYIDGSGAISPQASTAPAANRVQFTAPNRAGVWKIYLYARDGQGNVGIETVSLRVR